MLEAREVIMLLGLVATVAVFVLPVAYALGRSMGRISSLEDGSAKDRENIQQLFQSTHNLAISVARLLDREERRDHP